MTVQIIHGDCREMLPTLPAASVQCCVTSPPYYWLRDYKHDKQIGLEQSPASYVFELVAVFREVRRVLRDDGVLFLNLGDTFNSYTGNRGASTSISSSINDAIPKSPKGAGLLAKGLKNKDLIGLPWRVAFALQDNGWWLRSEIIWNKGRPAPTTATDRPGSSHEHVFLLSKSARYSFDLGGRLMGDVWDIPQGFISTDHRAVMPVELARRCIVAGSKPGDTVLDPFSGVGTTALVADREGRHAIGIELNPEYAAMGRSRVEDDAPLFAEVSA